MLTTDPVPVTVEDVVELLDGLKRNVRKTDDWDGWVDEEKWTDGKVFACLLFLEALVEKQHGR